MPKSSTRSRYTEIHVVGIGHVTPAMRRITFGGDGLAGLESVAPDQYVKLFFARDGGVPVVPEMPAAGDLAQWRRDYLAIPETRRPWIRTYTLRRHLAGTQQVEIDFALHDEASSGPASRWAAAARIGDVIGLAGPSASHRRSSGEQAWTLFVGDETALPAIGALVESLNPGERAVVYTEVENHLEEQTWETAGDVDVHWVHRSGGASGHFAALADQLRTASFPEGPPFAWVAGEASAARSLRRYLVEDRGIDKQAVAISAYWRAHMSEDDPLTAEDAAERAARRAALADTAAADR